MESPYQLL